MRWLAIAMTLAAVGRADAAPEKRCYAGVETRTVGSEHSTADLVATREVDPDAGEIRSHTWSSDDPDRDDADVEVVDAHAGTFTFVDPIQHTSGNGTLTGAPWHWTGYHFELALRSRDNVIGDGSVTGDTLTSKSALVGASPARTHEETLTAFDCRELDHRRAALQRLSPAAVHSCFAGTSRMFRGTRQVELSILVEQVIDDTNHRIELRVRTEMMPDIDGITRFELNGSAFTMHMSDSPHGVGVLVGKPGAWSQYVWLSSIAQSTGTFGGPHISQISILSDKTTALLDADAFDCKALAAKKAAFVAVSPKP